MRAKLLLTCATLALVCGTSAAAFAQACSSQLSNNVGDTITVTALLSTSDPNENGEGEPLLVASSGGEFSVSDDVYAIPQVYTYTATTANETITGTNSGADSDESCALTANSTPNSWFSPAQKATATKIAAAGATVSGASWLLAELCTGSTAGICGLPAGTIAASASLFTGLAALVAADPIDNNYTHLANVNVKRITLSFGSSTPANVRAAAAKLSRMDLVTDGIFNALYTTLNRASTAYSAGATQYVTFQSQYANNLEFALAFLFAEEVRQRTELTAYMQATSFDETLSASDALAFEQLVAASGLPAPDLAALASIGVTDPNFIAMLANFMVVQDVNALAGSYAASLSSSALTGALMQGNAVYGGQCSTTYLVLSTLGLRSKDPGYLAQADLNGDGRIDSADLAMAEAAVPKVQACFPFINGVPGLFN